MCQSVACCGNGQPHVVLEVRPGVPPSEGVCWGCEDAAVACIHLSCEVTSADARMPVLAKFDTAF